MAEGIRDKVAILGMGCTKFGERWESSAENLMVEAFVECIEDAGIEKKDIEAAYLGTCVSRVNVMGGATPLSMTLRLPRIPATRLENFCATGTEAFRAACYSVASGVYDIVLALGVEKLKDTGYGGLPEFASVESFMTGASVTAPGMFAQLATAYAAKHAVKENDLKRAMAQVSVKSHANAVLNPKAHLRRAVTIDQVMASPIVAHPLGLYDCCGMSDGSAACIVTTPEIAKSLKSEYVLVKGLAIANVAGQAFLRGDNSLIGGGDNLEFNFPETAHAAKAAYAEAGIKDARKEISHFEVHDCFSSTELLSSTVRIS